MRALWVNEGDELDVPRVRPHGFTHIFFSARAHSRDHLLYARAAGFRVGVYSNPEWYGFPDPRSYRNIVRDQLTYRFRVNDAQCDVQFNIEKTALTVAGFREAAAQNKYVIDLFYWWRRSNARRLSSWTCEGMQGGWFWPAFRHSNLLGTLLVPQAYAGDMTPWDPAGVVKDLVDWGVPFERVAPFVDAREVRPFWHGFAYMQNRLL